MEIFAKRVGPCVITDEVWKRVAPLIPALGAGEELPAQAAARPKLPRLVFKAIAPTLPQFEHD